MTRILLIRHAESLKNTRIEFSSTNLDRGLSRGGIEHISAARDNILRVAAYLVPGLSEVVCSNSARALETGKLLAEGTRFSVRADATLSSHVVDETAGMTEQELRDRHPQSSRFLKEYRHGLRSSTTIPFVRESLPDLRHRARRALLSHGNALLVAHRSFLTACLMEAAASSMAIGRDHFGYVPLDYLHISMIEKTDDGGLSLGFVNQPANALCKGLEADGWPSDN